MLGGCLLSIRTAPGALAIRIRNAVNDLLYVGVRARTHELRNDAIPVNHHQTAAEIALDVATPPAHAPARVRVRWAKRRPCERFVDVFADGRALGQDRAVVAQRGRLALRVDAEVARLEVLEPRTTQLMLAKAHALLEQREVDPAGVRAQRLEEIELNPHPLSVDNSSARRRRLPRFKGTRCPRSGQAAGASHRTRVDCSTDIANSADLT